MNEGTTGSAADLLTALLQLLAEDLRAAIGEADKDCTQVCQSLSDIACANHGLSHTALSAAMIHKASTKITSAVSACIVGLQYQDRLAQRVNLVLSALANLDLSPITVNAEQAEFSRQLLVAEIAYRLDQRRLSVEAGTERSSCAQPSSQARVEFF